MLGDLAGDVMIQPKASCYSQSAAVIDGQL